MSLPLLLIECHIHSGTTNAFLYLQETCDFLTYLLKTAIDLRHEPQ